MTTSTQLNTGSTPIAVSQGGIGQSTLTAYSPICSGASATAGVLSASGLGTSGYVLTSNGLSAAPSLQLPMLNKVSVTLLTADIKNMYATPVKILANQGANTIILVYCSLMQYVYNTAAFATGPAATSPLLQYGNTTNAGGPILFQSAMDITTSGNKLSYGAACPSPGFITPDIQGNLVNQGIYASNNTAAYTAGGSSSVIVTLFYGVISTTV